MESTAIQTGTAEDWNAIGSKFLRLLLQEKYVKKVVDTLGDLDNVLWEVGNELPGGFDFSNHIARLVKEHERDRPKQHPLGISTFYDAAPPMRALLDGPADWITPDTASGDYKADPPAADGKKVIISDTDHLWGVGGDADWVWKTFTRGMHPIYMDPLDENATRKSARRAMGDTRRFAERVDLAAMTPHETLSSTKYCLATPGTEYLIYQPTPGGQFEVELKRGRYRQEWFDTALGETADGEAAGDCRYGPRRAYEWDGVSSHRSSARRKNHWPRKSRMSRMALS